jgi:hypothetical protein
MAITPPASRTFRGNDTDRSSIFRLHFEWEAGMATSLHKHQGWELVLIRSGELNAIVDGIRSAKRAGEFIELPTGSVHAIWSTAPTEFDVLGRACLGLTFVIPTADGGLSDVPICLDEGPWAQRPPKGQRYTTAEEADELKRASLTLVPR